MEKITRPRPWLTNTAWDQYEIGILDGWETLVGDMLDAVGEEMSKYPDARLLVRQIKEKFGGLRFYYSLSENAPEGLHESVQEIYRKAENLSWVTCEECGAPGRLRNDDGWYLVRCDRHAPSSSKIVKVNS